MCVSLNMSVSVLGMRVGMHILCYIYTHTRPLSACMRVFLSMYFLAPLAPDMPLNQKKIRQAFKKKSTKHFIKKSTSLFQRI